MYCIITYHVVQHVSKHRIVFLSLSLTMTSAFFPAAFTDAYRIRTRYSARVGADFLRHCDAARPNRVRSLQSGWHEYTQTTVRQAAGKHPEEPEYSGEGQADAA